MAGEGRCSGSPRPPPGPPRRRRPPEGQADGDRRRNRPHGRPRARQRRRRFGPARSGSANRIAVFADSMRDVSSNDSIAIRCRCRAIRFRSGSRWATVRRDSDSSPVRQPISAVADSMREVSSNDSIAIRFRCRAIRFRSGARWATVRCDSDSGPHRQLEGSEGEGVFPTPPVLPSTPSLRAPF